MPIKGVNGTGTNLKKTTEKTESPKNHNKILYKICFNLTIKKNLKVLSKIKHYLNWHKNNTFLELSPAVHYIFFFFYPKTSPHPKKEKGCRSHLG